MRIFNKDKTKELFNCDLNKGYTIEDKLVTHIKGQKKIEEEGHYETITEYPNGGKDVEWIVDVPGQEYEPPRDDIEKIQIFIPYTPDEIRYNYIMQTITTNKNYLATTDYIIVKIAEKQAIGLDTTKDLNQYSEIIQNREKKRKEINELEVESKKLIIGEHVAKFN